MTFIGGALLRLLLSVCVLVLEVLLAIFLYIYLNTAQTDLFASLIGFSRGVLNMLIETFQSAAPQSVANAADVSLFGEIGPKAFLLLLLGLFASGVIRFFTWLADRITRGKSATRP